MAGVRARKREGQGLANLCDKSCDLIAKVGDTAQIARLLVIIYRHHSSIQVPKVIGRLHTYLRSKHID